MKKILIKHICTVGELTKALSKLPADTLISPFGSDCSKLVYDESEQRAYIDEDFSWAEDELAE